MKIILPIVFLAASVVIFFWYIDPAYARIQMLRAEEVQYDQALSRAKELREVRDKLIETRNSFNPEDIARLEKLLPNNVDNIRLVLDLDSLATQYGMRIHGIAVEEQGRSGAGDVIGPNEEKYNSLTLSFSVAGTYDVFRSFLADLERSLRLVDVVELTFNATESGIYEYGITIKTYWLKPKES